MIQGVEYLTCPIQPTKQDFKTSDQQFGMLQKLKMHSPYPSHYHFFNNHFFLLREDYLRDIRENIYSIKIDGFNQIKNKQLQNFFYYKDLDLKSLEITKNGFFADIRLVPINPKNFQPQKVNWTQTSRLKSGSLIILANLNCDTIICGIVADIPKQQIQQSNFLKYGNVNVKLKILEEQNRFSLTDFYQLVFSDQSIVIESRIFFQPYYQYLKSIQQINISAFPFSENILNFSPLVNQINYNSESYQARRNQMPYYSTRQVDLQSLDGSQIQAFNLMMEKSIALVQGPPGTGKTYCGALAVEQLLNQQKWPILIVCYTNHALDQFLGHILKFVNLKDIVRLGGRCKDENIQQCVFQKNQIPKQKIKFNFQDFYSKIDQLNLIIQTLFCQDENLYYSIMKQHIPQILNYIENDFLRILDWTIPQEFSLKTKQDLFKIWKDGDIPNKSFIEQIIILEKQYGNIINKGRFSQNFKKMKVKIKLVNQQQQQQQQQNINQSELIEELEYCDSEEEEDRIIFSKNILNGKKQGAKNSTKINLNNNKINLNYIFNEDNENYFDQKFQHLQNENMWDLTLEDRQLLIQYAIYQYQKQQELDFHELYDQYSQQLDEMQDKFTRNDIKYFREKKIIGVTINGCAIYAKMISKLKVEIMIIEEAAEVLESLNIAILPSSLKHLILIGDHQQLRPKVQNYELEKKYNSNISLFERLVHQKVQYVALQYQRRMKTKFADLIRLIYGNQYKDNHKILQTQNYIGIEGLQDDLIFFNHQNAEDNDKNSKSYSNLFEAKMILSMIRYLIQYGYKPYQITILSMYVKQVLKLIKLLPTYGLNKEIKIATVDNYQGEENDFIFLSLVRSNQNGRIGFVQTENRINVALSRARIGLFVFGNFDCIQQFTQLKPEKSQIWIKILNHVKTNQILQNKITLKCKIHKVLTNIMKTDQWPPESNCQSVCNMKMDCGHLCEKQCHIKNLEHPRSKCNKKCQIIHPCSHRCTYKCLNYPCPPCNVPVIKNLNCGHQAELGCSSRIQDYNCNQPCKRIMACGHQCQSICQYYPCPPCYISVVKKLPCEHTVEAYCSENLSNFECQENCQRIQSCGHICQQLCFEPCICYLKSLKKLKCHHSIFIDCRKNPPLNYTCIQKCENLLNCGHQCKGQCENGKNASFCPPCNLTQNVILPGCQHQFKIKCNQRNMLQKILCVMQCQQIHHCGKRCLGLCGEKCPPCEKIKKIPLQNCKHQIIMKCDQIKYRIICLQSFNRQCEKLPSQAHLQQVNCGLSTNSQCSVQLPKLQNCKHEMKIPCQFYTKNIICLQICGRILPCIHQCQQICSEPCKCTMEIPIKMLYCNHDNMVLCCDKEQKLVCQLKCQAVLSCGHICSGSCSKCLFSTLHEPCKVKCFKKLPCGHFCSRQCGESCSPCLQICTKKGCGHPCTNHICYEGCPPCLEPCNNQCEHFQCTKFCYQNCIKSPCVVKCQKLLACGCNCSGLCGEICPNYCVKHHNFQINFDLLYQLECSFGHLFDLNIISQHFSLCYFEQKQIKCPICCEVIHYSKRFKIFFQDKTQESKLLNAQEKAEWEIDLKKAMSISTFKSQQLFNQYIISNNQILKKSEKVNLSQQYKKDLAFVQNNPSFSSRFFYFTYLQTFFPTINNYIDTLINNEQSYQLNYMAIVNSIILLNYLSQFNQSLKYDFLVNLKNKIFTIVLYIELTKYKANLEEVGFVQTIINIFKTNKSREYLQNCNTIIKEIELKSFHINDQQMESIQVSLRQSTDFNLNIEKIFLKKFV